MEEPHHTPRFEKTDLPLPPMTAKIRNWINLAPTNDFGEFLARLWSMFGPTDQIHFEGFTYRIKDNETGIIFTAYCAGTGPAFGGSMDDREAVSQVIDAFEVELKAAPLADCEIEFPTDYGIFRTGAHDGVAFGKTYEEDPE